MGESGSYLYAIGRDPALKRLSACTGLRDAALRLVEQGGLIAVVSTVDLDEFGEDGLHRHLEDLQWLEETAVRHDLVVKEAAATATVAPLRLATICRTDDSVRRRLEEAHDDLVRALDRIEGRCEWSVKVYLAELESAGRVADEAAAFADELHVRLAASAEASRRLQPQDRRLSGHTGTMTLNGAYLVDVEREAEFRALVQDLADLYPGVRVALNGPWPPYSFATLDSL